MARTRFAWNNLIDYPASGIVASSSADGFPVGNLRHPFRTRPWKSSVGSGIENIVFDFGLLSGDFGTGYYSSGEYGGPPAEVSPQAVSVVYILDHNFTETVDCRIQGNDADSWDSPAVDEAIAYDPGTMVKFFTEGTYRYWRLSVDDSAGGNTQIGIGRLFVGTYFQPVRAPLIDMPYQIADPSTPGGPSGGGRFPDPKTMRVRAGVNFRALPESDRTGNGALLDMARFVGLSKDLFVSIDPENHLNRLSLYCRITSDLVFTVHPNGNHSVQFAIEELV